MVSPGLASTRGAQTDSVALGNVFTHCDHCWGPAGSLQQLLHGMSAAATPCSSSWQHAELGLQQSIAPGKFAPERYECSVAMCVHKHTVLLAVRYTHTLTYLCNTFLRRKALLLLLLSTSGCFICRICLEKLRFNSGLTTRLCEVAF